MILLKVISPQSEILSQNVDIVELPGLMGRFEVLTGHAPLISALGKGVIAYRTGAENGSIEIESGFAEVRDNIVTVCIE